MEVLEGQNILVTISGKKNRVRVYYLSWLKSKILRTDGMGDVSLCIYHHRAFHNHLNLSIHSNKWNAATDGSTSVTCRGRSTSRSSSTNGSSSWSLRSRIRSKSTRGRRSPTTSSWHLRWVERWHRRRTVLLTYVRLILTLQSFAELMHRPLLVDLTVEEQTRLKVIYGSAEGFHAVDLDSAIVYDIYLPKHVSRAFVIHSTQKHI